MGFWKQAWPYALAALGVTGGSVAGVVASNGDARVTGVGVAAVAATTYIIYRRIRGWPEKK